MKLHPILLVAALMTLPATVAAQVEAPPGVTWHDGPPAPPVDPGPPPEGWRKSVEDYLQTALKDPYSAVKRQSSTVWRGQFRTSTSWGKKIPAWAVCYAVNAKNSYGAYTGERFYLFLLSDDGYLIEAMPSGEYKYSRTAAASEIQRVNEQCRYAAPPPPAESEFTVPTPPSSPKAAP